MFVAMAVVGLVGCGSHHETPGLELLEAQKIAYYTSESAKITDKSTQYYHKCDFLAFAQTCKDSVDWTLIPKPGVTTKAVAGDVTRVAMRDGWTSDLPKSASDPSNIIVTLVQMTKPSSEGDMELSCLRDTPPTVTHLDCQLSYPGQPNLN